MKLKTIIGLALCLMIAGCNSAVQDEGDDNAVEEISENQAVNLDGQALSEERLKEVQAEFLEKYGLNEDELLQPLLADLNQDGIEEIIVGADPQANHFGRISIYNLEDRDELASMEVPDAASDRFMSIRTIQNPVHHTLLAVQTEYRDIGVDLYALRDGKLEQVFSVSGVSIAFEDMDQDGYEEIRVNEMDWLHSESMADASYKHVHYTWNGETYIRDAGDSTVYNVAEDALQELAGLWHPLSENADKIIKIHKKSDSSGELIYGDLMSLAETDPIAFSIGEIEENKIQLLFPNEDMLVIFEDESHARFVQGDNIMQYQKTLAYDEPVDWINTITGYWLDDEMGFYYHIEANETGVIIESTYGEGVFVRYYVVVNESNLALDLLGLSEDSVDIVFYIENDNLVMSAGGRTSYLTPISETEYSETANFTVEGDY